VSTDKIRLQQVLLNIQSNALKFTKPGGSVEIKVYFVKSLSKRLSGFIPMISSRKLTEISTNKYDSFFNEDSLDSESEEK
jgi:signal transduction histidine kinase